MKDTDSDRTEILYGSTRNELIGYAILYISGAFLVTVWWTVKNRPEMAGGVYEKLLEAAFQLVLGWTGLLALGLLIAVVGYAYIMEKRLKELNEREG